ncbi:hypothetical protein CRE_03235 [Caenorhabditis remanei]|uniref:Uncharacterized protein n=1 Tax=Caenorhabditis remanei TaxID=31234 RepID=E3MMH9_CAERE|nr:hypothetical protein CRE_03235 [Caenorhabditis remanei]
MALIVTFLTLQIVFTTAVHNPIQKNTNVEQDVLFFNGTNVGTTNTTNTQSLQYIPMVITSNVNQTFSEYMSYLLHRKKPLGMNFSCKAPAHFVLKHCNKTLWRTIEPIEKARIIFDQPWIKYFWTLEEKCSIKNTTVFLYAKEPGSSKQRYRKPSIYKFHIEANPKPIEEPIESQEVKIYGNTKNLFNVMMNALITKALDANLSAHIIFTYASSEDIVFQLVKCGFAYDFKLDVQPYKPILIEKELLNGFNVLKQIYCSTPSDDNLSFQLLAIGTTRDVNITMTFHLSTSKSLPTDVDFILFGGTVALILFIVAIICWIVRQNRKKKTYQVNAKVVYRKRQQITQKKLIKRTATIPHNKNKE